MKEVFLCVLLFIGCSLSSSAQQIDSVLQRIDTAQVEAIRDSVMAGLSARTDTVDQHTETRKERRAREKAEMEREKYYFKGIKKDSARLEIEHISRVAWRRSLILPGWGQYTNGGLWWIKVPVIYGGLVSAYFIFDYWQFYYREFHSELQYRFNNNGEGSDGMLGQVSNEQYLINQRDYARRNRDITVLLTLGWYGLNAVEAYVDSMLKYRWDISDDLSFKVSPTLVPTMASTGMGNPIVPKSLLSPGVKFSFNIR